MDKREEADETGVEITKPRTDLLIEDIGKVAQSSEIIKLNIIIIYRPLCSVSMISPIGPIHQLPDGRWTLKNGEYKYGDRSYPGDKKINLDELIRAIRFLNKNSHFKHNIIVVIDNDVFPSDDYLKEFNNVKIIKSKYIHDGPISTLTKNRVNAANIEGINSIPDEEWICYAYQSDLICAKDWDKYIIEAIQKYGDNHVYVPMFTEVRGGIANRSVLGLDPTPERIWDEWRRIISCHALTMPYPRKELFFTEDDMDYFIKRANEANKPLVIIERPGDRVYGYFALIVMKAKFAKKAMRLVGSGFDIDFDNRLYSECNLMKAVVTRSFVFHPICEFKY